MSNCERFVAHRPDALFAFTKRHPCLASYRTDARQGVLVQSDGNYASKRAAKAIAGNYTVLP